MSWRSAHGDEYDVPQWFRDNMSDESWKNDDSPKFTLGRTDTGRYHILVWVDHPDPDQQAGGSRWEVMLWDTQDDEMAVDEERNVATDDQGEAVEAVRALAVWLGISVPPALAHAAPAPSVDAADVETINEHRRGLGMGPIDLGAGWTASELADMARRIRRSGAMTNPQSSKLKGRLMR